MPSHIRNTLLVPELDKAIHKFARCCNPFPGQEHVVATLSERGITFHHENCKDLLERHDLPPQKLLNVEWDLENQWRHPLVFELQVFNETPVSLFPSFARLPSTIRIQSLSHVMEKGSQSFTRVGILLESFQEANAFFTCLPSYHVVIEDYGQGEYASGMFMRE
jgi:GTP pyrophosphokinase